MQNIKNINEITNKITRLANIKERLEKYMLYPSSSASAKSLSINYHNNITTDLRPSYDNKDKFIISKGVEAMIEEINNQLNVYQEELKEFIKFLLENDIDYIEI